MAHQYYHHHHHHHPAFSPSRAHHLHPNTTRVAQPTSPTRHHHHQQQPAPAPAPARTHHQQPSSAAAAAAAAASVDPVLAYHTHHQPIEFDVSLPIAQIMLSSRSSASASASSYTGLSPRHLAAPAVSPALPFMRIRCPSLLPWAIDVYPASHSGVVTVGDVLDAVYRGLRHHATEAEWNAAPYEVQDGARNAYIRRCKRKQSQKERVREEGQGLRRVDWLQKNTMFQGLTPGKSRDHWVMHLKPGEKTVKFALGS